MRLPDMNAMNGIGKEGQETSGGLCSAAFDRPYKPIKALLIGGLDPTAGGGVLVDAFAVSCFGIAPCPVITAVTAQNSKGVSSLHPLAPDAIARQIESILEDGPVAVVKTGMMPTSAVLDRVLESLAGLAVPLVVDPVLSASDGTPLFEGSIEDWHPLIRRATVITPNVAEAQRLTGLITATREDMQSSAGKLIEIGATWVLIKGGHLAGEDSMDLLVGASGCSSWFEAPRIDSRNVRGTGCMFASSLAVCLAKGMDVPSAAREAKKFVTAAIAKAVGLGKGSLQTMFSSKIFSIEDSS